MPEMTDRKGFVVRGRVQGVGFRWWTSRTAERLELAGTVRNRLDGSVEVMAVGPGARLAELERALHRGPVMARVDEVTEVPCDLPSGASGFTITG